MVIKDSEITGVKVPMPNERVLKVLMCPELGNTKDATVLVSIISPGSTTGLHTHDVDEYMYVVTGRGKSIEGGKVSEVDADSVIFAPEGFEHEVKNTSEETLKLFCVYVPALKPAGYLEKAIECAKKSLTKEYRTS